MTTSGCSQCRSADDLAQLGELAAGVPWFVCGRCLRRWGVEAILAQRPDVARDPALVERLRSAAGLPALR